MLKINDVLLAPLHACLDVHQGLVHFLLNQVQITTVLQSPVSMT